MPDTGLSCKREIHLRSMTRKNFMSLGLGLIGLQLLPTGVAKPKTELKSMFDEAKLRAAVARVLSEMPEEVLIKMTDKGPRGYPGKYAALKAEATARYSRSADRTTTARC
jgi:hypothetical protein